VIGNLSGPPLLDNNLLVRRDSSYVLSDKRKVTHNRIRYIVEPQHVPFLIPPLLPRCCLMTHLRLVKDMNHTIVKGHHHILWLKSHKCCMRFENGLDIAVLPENLLRQLKAPPVFANHDPTGVPSNVVKRLGVSLILVQSSDDINIHHQINEASIVSTIIIASRGFPSDNKRLSTIVVLHKFPQKELQEVLINSSL